MRKRWVVPTPTENDDEQLLLALRPKRLDEYIGQQEVVERLRIAIDAAKQRGEPLEHTLLYGAPGLGKTTLANVIANDPAIILADEPTGNLDLRTGKEIIELLKELNQEKGVTVISATHDLKMIDVSDRVIWIRDGQIARIEDRSKIRVEAALEVEEALMEGELPDLP